MQTPTSEKSRSGGYELNVGRDYAASAQALFDAYLALHGDQRPDWIVDSHLDLRVGGTWTVTFHPPGLEPFREVRVLSVVDPPRHLAYAMRATIHGRPEIRTTVDVAISEQHGRSHLSLTQRGFPSEDVRDEFASAWPAVLEAVQQYIR